MHIGELLIGTQHFISRGITAQSETRWMRENRNVCVGKTGLSVHLCLSVCLCYRRMYELKRMQTADIQVSAPAQASVLDHFPELRSPPTTPRLSHAIKQSSWQPNTQIPPPLYKGTAREGRLWGHPSARHRVTTKPRPFENTELKAVPSCWGMRHGRDNRTVRHAFVLQIWLKLSRGLPLALHSASQKWHAGPSETPCKKRFYMQAVLLIYCTEMEQLQGNPHLSLLQ